MSCRVLSSAWPTCRTARATPERLRLRPVWRAFNHEENKPMRTLNGQPIDPKRLEAHAEAMFDALMNI